MKKIDLNNAFFISIRWSGWFLDVFKRYGWVFETNLQMISLDEKPTDLYLDIRIRYIWLLSLRPSLPEEDWF